MWVKVFFLGCISVLPAVQGETRLRIIHMNDINARIDQISQSLTKCSADAAAKNKCYGGFARLVTAINAEKERASKDKIPLIILNGGDNFGDTLWYSVYKWHIIAEFVKLLGLDAMVLGNQEFHDGPIKLKHFLYEIGITTLACNIDASEEEGLELFIKPSVVIHRGGIQIGIIGYLTPELVKTSMVGKVKFEDEMKCVTTEAKKMKTAGVKIIIGLSHSGYERDKEMAAIADLDVIVGGHTHTFLYTGSPPDNETAAGFYPTMVTQSSGHKVAVVQAYFATKYLGSLEVVFNGDGEVTHAFGNPILLNSKINQDENVLKAVVKYQTGIDKKGKEVVGKTNVKLTGDCRFYECNIGNLIADAFVDFAVKNLENRSWTGATIGLYQGGGIRAPIAPSNGLITREDIMTILPFSANLVLLSLKGKYLREALEWSVERYDPERVNGRDEFLQVSGLQIIYDIKESVGFRVVQALVRCSHCKVPTFLPIDPEETYAIVTGKHIADGGHNFTMIKKHKIVIQQFDATDTDVVADYIKQKQSLYNGTEERIRFNSSPSTLVMKPIFLIFCATLHFCY